MTNALYASRTGRSRSTLSLRRTATTSSSVLGFHAGFSHAFWYTPTCNLPVRYFAGSVKQYIAAVLFPGRTFTLDTVYKVPI